MVKDILNHRNIHTLKQLDSIFEHGNSPVLEELYNYYLGSGEMPYGVAKARTSDPLEWMRQQIEPLLEANDTKT